MAKAAEEILKANKGEGCLGKAHPDEPVFILRGQDLYADFIVNQWADAAAVILGYNHPKVIEARELAAQMRAWSPRKLPD